MPDFSIHSGARTVLSVATFFAEMKQRAAALVAAQQVEHRGYFTPSEEDNLRGLQISYWQARAALLELAHAFHRQQAAMTADERRAAFIVAYAAVVLLVDAARFLRELVHARPTIRAKLNEPAAEFGIPRDAYETVQRSLTSPWHAWHLYHALAYLRENRDELSAVAREAGLADVWQIIERLGHRLDVEATRFVTARVRARSRQAARALRYDLAGRALFGIHKVVGMMMADVYVRPKHHPGLPPPIYQELRTRLQPGDVLVVRKEYALTNYFLPGFWPHAALYLGEPRELAELGLDRHANVAPRWLRIELEEQGERSRVLEAMKDGVLVRSLASPLKSDSVVVLRPLLPRDQIATALARGLAHEGKSYDFDFDFSRSDRIVCTEVVYRAYQGVGGIEFPLIRRAGRQTLGGRELVQMGIAHQFFTPAAVYSPKHSPAILYDEASRDLLERVDGETPIAG